ncbi:MAG TPA: amidohydrolase family protein [Petrotogaceae bacterium]|mgnify:FL=1|nr:amidohydrolase family protein [Petrotogaceae bacterium]
MKKKLLKNAYIIISADFPVQKADILISENEILQVFPNGYNEKNFQEIEVWDMSGKLITPGFINSHSHVAMTLFRGVADDMNFKEWLFDNMLPREELLDDESVYYASMLA